MLRDGTRSFWDEYLQLHVWGKRPPTKSMLGLELPVAVIEIEDAVPLVIFCKFEDFCCVREIKLDVGAFDLTGA